MSASTTQIPWIGVMVRYTDFLTGRNVAIPGWKCVYCGAEYRGLIAPTLCGKCAGDGTTQAG